MKLYMVPLAPNPTKVMLYLSERAYRGDGLDIEYVMINTVKGAHKLPGHMARNPFGTLPVLEVEDQRYLIESLSIIEYFEDAFPEHAFLPTEPFAKAQHRQLERIIDLKVATPMAIYAHAVKSPIGYPADPQMAASLKAQMQTPLDYIESLLAGGQPFLTGDDVCLADFTLQPALQFLRFIEDDLIGNRANLKAWDERFRARPAVKSVLKW